MEIIYLISGGYTNAPSNNAPFFVDSIGFQWTPILSE